MKKFNLWLLILIIVSVSISVYGQISDPIPTRITKSGLSAEIVDVIQVPASSSSSPKARINLLKHANDNSGRRFVNDLRGKLYVIVNSSITTYLDLKAQHPNFKDSTGLGTGFGAFAFHPNFASNGKLYTSHAEAAGSGTADFEQSLSSVALQWVF
jgi:hypothetical protein